MGIGLLVIGTVFLLNPNINIVDILPDFIGYLLIYKGLSKMADLDDRVGEAHRKAFWLIFVGLAKCFCMLFIPTANDSDVLLLTFSFSVVELLLCLPMFFEFFRGMNYMCARYDNTTALKREGEAKFFIVAFVIIKAVLPLVPELFALDDTLYGYQLNYDYSNRIQSLSFYKRLSIVGAFVIVLICGVVMGIKFISYLLKLKNDKEFVERMEQHYRETVLSNTELWRRRHMNTVLTLFAVGLLFFNNFYLDTFPVIPDMLGCVLLLCGALYLSKLKVNAFGLALVSMLGAACETGSDVYRLICSNFGAVSHYDLYYYTRPIAIITDVLCCGLLACALIMMLSHVQNITSGNRDGIVFPKKMLSVFAVFISLSQMLCDLLPLLQYSPLEQALPDYQALFSFVIQLLVLGLTFASAAKIVKMRENPQF